MASDPQGQAGTPGDDDLYEVLGLSPTATPDEVDAAYHRLLNGLITTVANTGEAAERLRRRRIRLANAYAVLADPAQRAAYNARMGISAAPISAAPISVVPPAPAPMPPVAAPETTPPPAPMPEVHPPATTPPPVPMPEVRPPHAAPPVVEPPVEEARAVVTPLVEDETEAELSTPDGVELEGFAPEEADSVAAPPAPGGLEPAPEVRPRPLDPTEAAGPAPQPAALTEAEMADGGAPADATTALPVEEPAPVVDDTPAPWQAPGAPPPGGPPWAGAPPGRRRARRARAAHGRGRGPALAQGGRGHAAARAAQPVRLHRRGRRAAHAGPGRRTRRR